ncbi:MAG: NYN domain-containing protein [Anaerolineales bacterium]
MPFIIDGHNLIGQMPEISLKEIDDEQQLIEILQEFCFRGGRTVEVYFDNAPPGVPRARNYGRLTAFYTRTGKSADQAINERLHRLGKEARNWTVVSSDLQVQAMAKAVRAKVISASSFARQLRQLSRQKNTPHNIKSGDEVQLSDSDLDEWLKLFGVE